MGNILCENKMFHEESIKLVRDCVSWFPLNYIQSQGREQVITLPSHIICVVLRV